MNHTKDRCNHFASAEACGERVHDAATRGDVVQDHHGITGLIDQDPAQVKEEEAEAELHGEGLQRRVGVPDCCQSERVRSRRKDSMSAPSSSTIKGPRTHHHVGDAAQSLLGRLC